MNDDISMALSLASGALVMGLLTCACTFNWPVDPRDALYLGAGLTIAASGVMVGLGVRIYTRDL
jgi:hypothetical protein